jgi:phosphate/sulfate permease
VPVADTVVKVPPVEPATMPVTAVARGSSLCSRPLAATAVTEPFSSTPAKSFVADKALMLTVAVAQLLGAPFSSFAMYWKLASPV